MRNLRGKRLHIINAESAGVRVSGGDSGSCSVSRSCNSFALYSLLCRVTTRCLRRDAEDLAPRHVDRSLSMAQATCRHHVISFSGTRVPKPFFLVAIAAVQRQFQERRLDSSTYHATKEDIRVGHVLR